MLAWFYNHEKPLLYTTTKINGRGYTFQQATAPTRYRLQGHFDLTGQIICRVQKRYLRAIIGIKGITAC